MPKSKTLSETFTSKALSDNPLGDPNRRVCTIYLPPNYENDQFPVIYLLAGFLGSGQKYLNWIPWEETIPDRMDRLISEDLSQEFIVVMPDCFTRFGGSQYLNSSAIGNYQDYLLEVVDWVDQRFNTIADRDYRAIVGKSSGGYGGLMAAIEHPETFGLVADHSGDKFFEKCYGKDLLRLPDLVAEMEVESILEDPSSFRPRTRQFYELLNIAAMSACYSPNPDQPLGFDWPIDVHTGELRKSVWQRWKDRDPVHILEANQNALESLRLLYFDCGNRDEYLIHLGCRLMSKRLKALGIKHMYEEFEGGHRQTSHRLDRSISLISAVMA
jgi:enterochelin esterase family protein